MLNEKKRNVQKILICIVFIVILIGTLYSVSNVKSDSIFENTRLELAYNKEQFIYLSDINYEEGSSAGWGSITLDKNSDGELLSLIKDGKRTYFLKGVFAHANSTLIYDVSKYSYDYFTSYIGVDASRNDAGNVKFKISTSQNGEDWTVVKSTDAFLGNSESEFISIPLENVKYLKLEANTNGVATSDHSIYGNAKLIKEGYVEEISNVDFIKELNDYDEMLKNHSVEEIISDETLSLALLQRNLVKNVGYEILQVYASGEVETKETLEWLFKNKEILKMYTTGGKPLGNYISSLKILTDLYHAHKEDINTPIYQKLMIAISLTHSNPVCFWVSGKNNSKVCSDPLRRYEVLKDLYQNQKLNTEVVDSLSVEELRWVVDNQLSDDEITWLNWFSTETKNGKTVYPNKDGYLNPYTYIAYDYKMAWNYYDEGYYELNSLCATDNKNKFFEGYSRSMSCDQKYHLDEFNVNSHSSNIPRLWVVFEEDGVCGSLAKTGANLLASYGYPTAVIGQPGHAAYLSPSKVKDESTGKFITTWGIGNSVSPWYQSEKGERFPLNWGSKANGWHSYYNVSYIILIQDAFNDFENYEDAMMILLTTDLYKEDYATLESIYRKALKEQSFHLDAWKGLVDTYNENKAKTGKDYLELAEEIVENMKNYPLAMNDLLKLIESHILDIDKIQYNNLVKDALQEVSNEASTLKTAYHPNYNVIKEMADYILGNTKSLEVATFSFDGENKNSIVLQGTFAENHSPFRFSLDNEKTWREVVDGSTIVPLTEEELNQLNETDDIYIHIIGSSNDKKNMHVIDILKASTPKNLYVNDLENKIMGDTSNMEWTVDQINWKPFSEGTPIFNSNETVYVRYHKYQNYLPGESVTLKFNEDEVNEKQKYITIDRLSVTARSTEHGGEEATKIIDGNKYTMWHSDYTASNDKEKYITLEIQNGAYLSKIEYLPRLSGENGIIKDVTILGSVDGKTWNTLVEHTNWDYNHQLKSVELEDSQYVKFVKFEVKESKGGWVSGSMINLFEDTTKELPKEEIETPKENVDSSKENENKEKEETQNQLFIDKNENEVETHQDSSVVNDSFVESSSNERASNENVTSNEKSLESKNSFTNETNIEKDTETEKEEESIKQSEDESTTSKDQKTQKKETTKKIEDKTQEETTSLEDKEEYLPWWTYFAIPIVVIPFVYGLFLYFRK